MAYLYNGNENQQTTTCNSINQFYKYNVEQKNPDTKDYILLYTFNYIMVSTNPKNLWC